MYSKTTIQDQKLIKFSSYLAVIVAIVIMISKSYGWFYTESQSMLASLVDSILDISSSIINLIAIRVSLTPPDDNHRFGHEKFQDLAIFSQSIFFLSSCIFTLFSASKALLYTTSPINNAEGAKIMYFCTIMTLCLVIFQTYVFNKTKSKIIAADKLHYLSDLFTNIIVIISLKFSANYWFLDSILGIAISLYIMHASYKLFKEAIKNLCDEELSIEEKNRIVEIIKNHKEVLGIHELKTRNAANKAFIQFHLEMDGNISLHQAHELSDKISLDILTIFPNSEITIHQDPAGIEQNVNYREKF